MAQKDRKRYRGRVNNGEPLSIALAIQACDAKSIDTENSLDQTTKLLQEMKGLKLSSSVTKEIHAGTTKKTSPTSTLEHPSHDEPSLQAMIQALSVNDEECVAKVCPDRIYSVAVHPSTESTIVCAGDKAGYVGLWKRSTNDDDEHDIHCLFRPHRGAVSCLEWNTSGRSSKLWSTSYDGTVRSLDVETQQFDQIFATYDDDDQYKSKLGYGLDCNRTRIFLYR